MKPRWQSHTTWQVWPGTATNGGVSLETLLMISMAIFYLAFAWWVLANTETGEGDTSKEDEASAGAEDIR